MTDYPEELHTPRRERRNETPRRRSSDFPQPLDYPTRELVKDIVESKAVAPAPEKSFLRKLLDLGRH